MSDEKKDACDIRWTVGLHSYDSLSVTETYAGDPSTRRRCEVTEGDLLHAGYVPLARAEAAEAKVEELESRLELVRAQRDTETSTKNARIGSLDRERRDNGGRALALETKVEELRASYIASESRYAAEVIARFAAEQEVKELQAELDSAIDEERIRARDAVRYEQERDEVQHRSLDLEQECQRLRGQLEATKLDFANACDVGRRLESRLRELETPPVPQVAEAMEAMEARRCGNAWHTDCDLRWTHCFPLNPEPSPAQGEREKLAGTPLTVEMMVEALRAGQLAWAKDDNVWDVIADELERAAKERT